MGTDKVGGQPFYGVIDRVTIGTVDDVVNVNIGRPVRSFEPLLWNRKIYIVIRTCTAAAHDNAYVYTAMQFEC